MATSPVQLVQQAIADPDPRDRLRAISELRDGLGELEVDAVHAAVHGGASWSEIAEVLGVSRQSAHKRFAKLVRGARHRPARPTEAVAPQIVVTARARHAVRAARAAARALGHDAVHTGHLLLGLVADVDCAAGQALDAIGVRFDAAQTALANLHPPRRRRRRARAVPISGEAREALEQSLRETLRLGHSQLGCEHLLLGIVRNERSSASRVLAELAVAPGDLERCLGKILMQASFDAR